ncbi:tyrosine aminotransferase isoform X2 [Candoia aspera]|uniref:tyrosine aminotransferase isoform X2 n=1 Tax=Candoia aspera TaxID=51853 RepID=UPI002FD8403F
MSWTKGCLACMPICCCSPRLYTWEGCVEHFSWALVLGSPPQLSVRVSLFLLAPIVSLQQRMAWPNGVPSPFFPMVIGLPFSESFPPSSSLPQHCILNHSWQAVCAAPALGRDNFFWLAVASEKVVLSSFQLPEAQEAAMLKLSKTDILVILAIQVAVLCFIFQLYHSPQEKLTQKHILILSSWRSGSSFVGQLFSQHPNVFYLMEPAWHVWAAMYQNSAKVLHMAVRDLVQSVFKCDMSVFDAYMNERRNKSALFQWETSRALCSPPACDFFQRSDIISKRSCKTLCGNYPFSKVEEACKTYSHVVLKEVRFFDLKVLYPLLTDPSLNLRIIHLVRDPRAVFHSRVNAANELARDTKIVVRHKNNMKDMKPYAIMNAICKSHIDIHTGVKQSFKDRYLLVRYEDIVKTPLARAAQLYHFAGLHFLPSLQSWVHNITHGQGLGTKVFDTDSRDAMNVSRAWRKTLSYLQTATVQNICKDAMELLGYQPARSENEQKNMAFDLLYAEESLTK